MRNFGLLTLLSLTLTVPVGELTAAPPPDLRVKYSGPSVSRFFDPLTFGQTHAMKPGLSARNGLIQSRDPDAMWREIKSLAQAKAASSSLPFIRPSFKTTLIGSTTHLEIKRGDVGNLGFGNDPYGISLRKQILIEAIRLALAEAHLGNADNRALATQDKSSVSGGKTSVKKGMTSSGSEQWQCYLDQAEQLVRQTVVAIETITNKDQLNQLLQRTEDQIDDLLYDKLFKSIEHYAEMNHYDVVIEKGGDSPTPFSVSIISVPSGAKVWMMTDLVYRMQLITKTDPSQWPWKEIVQNPADLLGPYRYMARWQDGRHAEGDIDVTSATPLTFSPQ